MSYYVTLEGEKFEISELPKEDLRIYRQVCKFLGRSSGWIDFANFWANLVVGLYGETAELTEKTIYKICQDLECRLGIQQGFVGAVGDGNYAQEILPGLSQSFSDKGKLILTFSAVDIIGAEIDKDVVDFYVYILEHKRIMPFSYSFHHTPYPYSSLLHDELAELISVGYIQAASPISITPVGNEWIEAEIGKHAWLCEVREKVGQEVSWIKRYVGHNEDRYTLFELCYAMITSY